MIMRKREDKTRLNLVEKLEGDVVSSGLAREVLPDMSFDQFFECKGVDYSGEEVQVARRFEWRMIEAACPEAVGSLELEEFCEGGTLTSATSNHSCCRLRTNSLGRRPTSWWTRSTGRRSARGWFVVGFADLSMCPIYTKY